MSPWLLNILFDRMVRQVNERAAGRGVRLIDEKEGGWEIKQVLYADDTLLVGETREHLPHIVIELERACGIMGPKVNVGKSKVLAVKKGRRGSCEKGRVSGEEMQEVDALEAERGLTRGLGSGGDHGWARMGLRSWLDFHGNSRKPGVPGGNEKRPPEKKAKGNRKHKH